MLIHSIIEHLESIAPPSLQESYDNSGLLVGNKNTAVTGVLITLDSTEDIVEEAIIQGCNLIVAHHPIIFSGLKRLNGNNYIERTIIKAIQHNIAIYAIHTNLDNVYTGVNAKIAEKLGLQNTKILQPKSGLLSKLATFCPTQQANKVRQAIFNAGAGHIGNYNECSFNALGTGTFRGNESSNPFVGNKGEQHQEEEVRIECIFPNHLEKQIVKALLETHPYEEVAYDLYPLSNKHEQIGSGMIGELPEAISTMNFLQDLKNMMQTDCVRYTKAVKPEIKRVALCGGSGSFLLNNAIAANADIFITADYKYHQFFDADGKIIIADIGHYESEQFTKELLYDELKKKFPTFAVRFSKVNTNPINYL